MPRRSEDVDEEDSFAPPVPGNRKPSQLNRADDAKSFTSGQGKTTMPGSDVPNTEPFIGKTPMVQDKADVKSPPEKPKRDASVKQMTDDEIKAAARAPKLAGTRPLPCTASQMTDNEIKNAARAPPRMAASRPPPPPDEMEDEVKSHASRYSGTSVATNQAASSDPKRAARSVLGQSRDTTPGAISVQSGQESFLTPPTSGRNTKDGSDQIKAMEEGRNQQEEKTEESEEMMMKPHHDAHDTTGISHAAMASKNEPQPYVAHSMDDAIAVAAEVAPDEEDIEARVRARLQEETKGIVEQVQQRLIGEAIAADVVEPEDFENGGTKGSPQNPWCVTGFVIAIILVVVVAIVLGVLLSGGDGGFCCDPEPTDSPTSSPTLPLPPRFRAIKSKLDGIYGEDENPLDDESSLQFTTLTWLVDDDPAMLSEGLPAFTFQQRFVMALFYFSTNGNTTWSNQVSFMSDLDVCDWNDELDLGLFCNDGSRVVDRILLPTNGLRGSIPSEFGILDLSQIRLHGNELTGQIPPTLGLINSLEVVRLHENLLTGTLPESIFALPRLSELHVFSNPQLGGTLPESVGDRGKLVYLDLDFCDFTGTIPESIGNLRQMRQFWISENEFVGPIPSSLLQLPALEVLFLPDNLLTGTIPEFGGMDSLWLFNFDNNLLTGTIPASLGSLPRLERISFANNRLNGTLPTFEGNQGVLSHVWFNQNQLTGGITDLLSSLSTSALNLLYIHENQLTGTIPELIGQFTNVLDLNFEANYLNGTIPTQLGYLTMMDNQLTLSSNRLSGTIPTELGLLADLQWMDLGFNAALSGTLPTEIGRMNSLYFLQICSSMVGGGLPEELGQLDGIQYVGLHDNRFEGTVPLSLQSLDSLLYLWLHGNNLVGDLSPIFCTDQHSITSFQADCLGSDPEIECDCCTQCCTDGSGTCEDV